jgi:hypothetical protein
LRGDVARRSREFNLLEPKRGEVDERKKKPANSFANVRSLLGQRDTTPEKQLKISLIASYSIDSRAFLEEAKPTWLHEAVNTRKNPLSWLSKHEI